MKIVEEREAWIHTHYLLDGLLTTQQQRTLSMQVEPEIRQMGIQYGLHYKLTSDKARSIVVLECIPLDEVRQQIRNLIAEQIKDFEDASQQRKNVVTQIRVEPAEEGESPPSMLD